MPSVVKSLPRQTTDTEIDFVEWSYGNWKPFEGQKIAWFTPETKGGVGLFAIGTLTKTARNAGKNAKGNDLVQFSAVFDKFNPRDPLRKEHFRALPRVGAGSPIQHLNRCLYINSHTKVAEIDQETFDFLSGRF